MRDFKKGRGFGRQYLRMAAGLAALALLAVVAVGSARAAWDMYQKFAEASAQDSAAQAELAGMETQYANVSATVEGLQTERGVEAAVRQRYGVGKPGESEIDIVRQASTTAGAVAAPQGFWESFWNAIKIW